MSTVNDVAVLNELRRMSRRIERLESQLSQFVTNTTNRTNHSTLQQLDYASAGHTGFAATTDLPVGANPTGTVGTSVVNGSALTFMRSDAAPPLGATALAKMIHTGADASPPGDSEPLWIVTDGGPFGNGSMRLSLDGGSTYKETGIVFS